MRAPRRRGRWTAALISTALLLTAAPVTAQPASDADGPAAAEGSPRAEEPQRAVTAVPDAPAAADGPSASTATVDDPPGKPRNDVIEDVPVDENDASIPLNLAPYHDFPPMLRDLQESDRVSVEIIGESVEGRDLHLVVVTDMEDADWDEWQRLSDLRTDDPVAALEAFEDGEYDDWRAPIFINNNIHGNEWEGTDAFFEFAEDLAFSDDEATLRYLEEFLFVGVVSNNPDGRVNATRANAAGFDMNRDWVAQTQPEVRAVRDQILRYDPVSLLDQHGYVFGTLIEPTTGPHGQNYEMDLYIRHALRAAEAMEQAIADLDEPRATTPVYIPFRDWEDDWDGWPAVYTPMWAMQHGVVGHTIEFPLNPRGVADEEERHERTRINTAVALATMEGNLDYLSDARDDVVADQLEFFRRGVAGEPTRPIDDEHALDLAACGSFVNQFDDDRVVEHCNSDTYPQDFPRAWVLPAGEDQRSATAAARTVQYLLDNDIEVHRATEPVSIGDEEHPAGTYVVDMHQAKRGAANNALETGRNLSDDWRAMYGDAAWSVGATYGATLVEVRDEDLDTTGLVAIDEPAPTGSVPAEADHLGLEIDSLYGVQAVNALLGEDVDLQRLPDGTFVAPAEARDEVEEVATTYGVEFVALSDARVRGAVPFDTRTVGMTAFADQAAVLARMGFDLELVTTTRLNEGEVRFEDLDALFVGAGGFNPAALEEGVAADFEAWLADGNAVVGQGANGAAFNTNAELLPVTISGSAGSGDGIVAVVNDPDSPITGDALDVTFVRSPRWFPGADEVEGVTVDQYHAEGEDYFLAGHWRRYREGAGQPVVVSGEAQGAYVTLFATDPTARAHPEGLFPQVAEALWMPPAPPVDPLPPVADAGGPYEIELGDEVTLDASASTSPDERELSFVWDLSELGMEPAEGETVTVTPTELGTFGVEVTVTDDRELSDAASTTVTVTEPDPGPGPDPEPGPACDDVEGESFPDVRGGDHADNIACVAGYGIAWGKKDGTYDPRGTVRRDQMASFLHRVLRVAGAPLPRNAPDAWPDDDGSLHEGAINDLTAMGIIEGRTGGQHFDPSGSVTRAQMASFLVRTLETILDRRLTAPPSPFTDIRGSVHARNIDVAHDLGIARGRTPTQFVPQVSVRRDQMASFIARTLDVLVDEDVELTPIPRG